MLTIPEVYSERVGSERTSQKLVGERKLGRRTEAERSNLEIEPDRSVVTRCEAFDLLTPGTFEVR